MVSISSALWSKSLSFVSTGFSLTNTLHPTPLPPPPTPVRLVSSSHLDVPLLFPWCKWSQPQQQPLYISLRTSALLLLFLFSFFLFSLATSYL